MAPAAAAPVFALGEDLLREVFIRLPTPADLVRAAAACKPFLRVARCAPFLRHFRRRHPSSCPRLLGCLLFLRNRCRGRFRLLPVSPSPSSAASSSSSSAAADANGGGDFALSFLPGGGWGLDAAAWEQLDCRNGRLLVKNAGSQELAVADPISRRHVSLPAPPAGRALGYGLFADDGDSSEFRVVCVSRDAAASGELRALLLSSGELSWADVAGVACQLNLAAGSRAMQANRSLYWRLEGGEGMLAFSSASMEFSVLKLPPNLRELSFDAIDRGEEEDVSVLHLLTMSGFCIEVWAGTGDGDGGMAWRRVEKSVRFHKLLKEIINPSRHLYQRGVDVIGVAAGVVFLRQWNHLFSIDLETMKLKMLPSQDCWDREALICPYTITWPPSFLNPAGQVD